MGKKNNNNKKKAGGNANNSSKNAANAQAKNAANTAGSTPSGSANNQPTTTSPNNRKATLPTDAAASLSNGAAKKMDSPTTPARQNSTASTGRAEPSSNDPEELKEQGNFYFKEKDFDVAIELYTSAIALKQDATYYGNRSAAYVSLNKWQEAKNDCAVAISLSGDSPAAKTVARMSKCLLMLGEPGPALEAAEKALAIDPTNAQAQSCKDGALQMKHYLDRVTSAEKLGDWGQAKWALGQAFEKYDKMPVEWRVLKIELDIAKKQWEDALNSATDAVRQDTNSPDLLASRGLTLFLMNQIAPAMENLKAAVRIDQEHARARTIWRRVKDVERVKEEGNTHFKKAEFDKAVDKYSETLDLIGEEEREGGGGYIRSVLLSNRATTLLKLQRHEEALKDTQAAISLMPNSFKPLRTQARVHMAMEKYEEAVRDFKAAESALGSDSPGDLSALRDELKKAEVALKRSKTKDYYKILNIHREASESEIKKAYRRESLLHHPDKGGDEEKFKLVSEANTVLSDPQRRARYDRGEDEDGTGDGGMGMNGMDLSDLLFQMGNGGGFGGFGGGGRRGGGFPGGHFHHGHNFGFSV